MHNYSLILIFYNLIRNLFSCTLQSRSGIELPFTRIKGHIDVSSGKIKFIKDGRGILLDINDMDDWIGKNKTQFTF